MGRDLTPPPLSQDSLHLCPSILTGTEYLVSGNITENSPASGSLIMELDDRKMDVPQKF